MAPTMKMSLKASVFILATLLGVTCTQAEDTMAFEPRTVIPRAFPAIVEPETVPAGEAQGTFVKDEELVLGVVVNGEARAYPINTLTGPQREIINDRLGGQAIAATW